MLAGVVNRAKGCRDNSLDGCVNCHHRCRGRWPDRHPVLYPDGRLPVSRKLSGVACTLVGQAAPTAVEVDGQADTPSFTFTVSYRCTEEARIKMDKRLLSDTSAGSGQAGDARQKERRVGEFIKPLNTLQAKVGYGGLSDDILTKAETLLRMHSVTFQPLAGNLYLAAMMRAIETARYPPKGAQRDELIIGIIYPAMQIMAAGEMFGHSLVICIADKLIGFLDALATLDDDALEIAVAFHMTLRAVLMGHITDSGGKHGDELVQALRDACGRYFEVYPENRVQT